MRLHRLPLSYDECRARFRHVAVGAGVDVDSSAIEQRGPDGQELTVDVVAFGAARPRRALVVLSGVHGVEGFVGSALQCDLVERLGHEALPDDVAVFVVHAVNPWGMAWWRRQNESNVDLNRNWRRDDTEPNHNDAYDELHDVACPSTPTMPSADDLLVAAAAMVDEKGLTWVRDAITVGQYRHRNGLHYGGECTEASSAILERFVAERLVGVERLLTIDLHTGHGPRGEITVLSDAPPGSAQHEFFARVFGADRVEATTDNPDATTGHKSGQIANGFAQMLGDAQCFATSLEFGTAKDGEQLVATYLENWVHHHGDRHDPEHRAVTWRYRCCFTPDDPAWEEASMRAGTEALDRALAAVVTWTD